MEVELTLGGHEYKIVKTVKFEHLNQRIGYRGFHRMVKELH